MLETAQPMTAEQFARLARIVHQDSGIALAETKKGLLMARTNRRLRSLKMSDYSAYCDFLERPDGVEERRHLLVAVTTNVTAFFREAHHFELLSQQILPGLVTAARRGARVRLWSAACSSGEEPYSMAMTVLDAFPEAARHDVLILATDIDPDIVARARAAQYDAQALKGLDAARRDRYFTRAGERYMVRPEVQKLVRFAELNLHRDWPFSGQFDVILCRNVVIYFDIPMRQQLWQKFARALQPNGCLMIGHSERIDGPAANMFQSIGTTAYQLMRDRIPMNQ